MDSEASTPPDPFVAPPAQGTGPGANAELEGAITSSSNRPIAPLRPLQRAGWATFLSSGLALTGAGMALGFAQAEESRARRRVASFDLGTGKHPIYADVQTAYEQDLQNAGRLRTTALTLGITAGVAVIVGTTLFLVDRSRIRREKGRANITHALVTGRIAF